MSKFEEYEYYIQNKDFLVSDRIITFNDTNGRLLALKPDVTLSIIKNCEDRPGCKQKVYYNENIYRVSGNTGHYKEIMQTGLECIGDIDLYDIYETVSLAAQSLALVSEDFVLQISHLGILSAVLDRICPNSKFQQAAIGYISGKNAHDLDRLCKEYGVEEKSARMLSKFVCVYGQRKQVLSRLDGICGQWAGEALDELKQLSGLLDRSPYSDRIIFDFSVVNNMNYYNGIVFKGFIDGLPSSVLSGGQYDKLMQKMGKKAGAIGFAVYLDLLERLAETSRPYDVDALLLYDETSDLKTVSDTVHFLTGSGKIVLAGRSVPENLKYKQLLKLQEGRVKILENNA